MFAPPLFSHCIFDFPSSGEAIGSSPLRAVFRACLQKLVADERYWQSYGRYVRIRAGPADFPEREEHLTLCGFFALWHMVAVRVGPHPISPFLLRYVIEGRERACALDLAFLRLIDPELYERLLPWAQYEWGSSLPVNPLDPLNTLLFSASLDVSVILYSFVALVCPHTHGLPQRTLVSDPPRAAELHWLERQVVASVVFGGTELASGDSLVSSFGLGMHLVLAAGQTLDEVCTPSSIISLP